MVWSCRENGPNATTKNYDSLEARRKEKTERKDGIYTAINETDLRMGEWNNRRQWNMKVGRRRQNINTLRTVRVI